MNLGGLQLLYLEQKKKGIAPSEGVESKSFVIIHHKETQSQNIHLYVHLCICL